MRFSEYVRKYGNKPEQMHPCITTGRLVRAYLNVALPSHKAIDKIGTHNHLIWLVAREMMELEKASDLRRPSVIHGALMTLRKQMALPTLRDLRTGLAVGWPLADVRS